MDLKTSPKKKYEPVPLINISSYTMNNDVVGKFNNITVIDVLKINYSF